MVQSFSPIALIRLEIQWIRPVIDNLAHHENCDVMVVNLYTDHKTTKSSAPETHQHISKQNGPTDASRALLIVPNLEARTRMLAKLKSSLDRVQHKRQEEEKSELKRIVRDTMLRTHRTFFTDRPVSSMVSRAAQVVKSSRYLRVQHSLT